MDIKFLQSLDFLIQKANKEYPTKKWNIVFELNNELLTANFINDTNSRNVIFNNLESDDEVDKIPLMSEKSYRQLRSGNDFMGIEAPLKKLIRYLDTKSSFDIYRLLKSYIDNFEIDPSNLDNFAFDVKNLKTGECFSFIEIDESSKIQFVTLATDEDLQTLTHVSK
ncbi:hypothetical protein [Staphylococcus borealis]|uniref:Uncharacterized protein n=1 Tax=Staphylococcus borealis TaxID=2742203 RepID=A0ABX2LV57_9STAP|nr:hypothetical protein [Staphylococcus borealis]NUI83100.1 hypothetical protein [Staphylococcus borealis]NUI93509.1 hypothetical protein [Staphylococcus borealis]